MTEHGRAKRSMIRAGITLAAAALFYEALARSGNFPAVLLPTLPTVLRRLSA